MDATLQFSRPRITLYLLALAWLLLTPVFRNNAAHFGWGFLPSMISCLLVPGITIGMGMDLVLRTVEARAKRCDPRKSTPAIAFPLFLFLVSCVSLVKLFGQSQ